MSFLVDTNVISELRRSDRCSPAVRAWFDSVAPVELYLSILTIAEIRLGAERISRRDPKAGAILLEWVEDVEAQFEDRIVGIDRDVAKTWAKISTPDPLPFVDGFLAATALVRGLTLVTRDKHGVARTGVRLLDPFDYAR